MAYVVLNKSGCEERKGNVKVRLDYFLDPTDPRYSDRYLYLVDVTSAEYLAGYPGEVDKDGLPVDAQDNLDWYEALPHVWQNTPFHSHFAYFGSDVTQDDIKAEMEVHLANFYKAFQERRDEENGGMRHGWATETRIKPTDYSKTDTTAEYDTRVAECQAVIDSLTEFSFKPEGKVEGQEFPATEIDIGPGAIAGPHTFASYTLLHSENTANDTGTIDTFEVWADTTMDGTNKVGTFYGSTPNFTNRDGEIIGTVTSGAKRTFTGLTIDVTTGDFAGIYFSAGKVERDQSGVGYIYYKAGDQFGAGSQAFNSIDTDTISIYGTGETAEPITAYIDIPIRFRLWARAFKDIATRFKSLVQGYQDTTGRALLWGVTTQAATGVGTAEATLNGTVVAPDGENCVIRGFEWGTTDGGSYPNTWQENGSFAAGAYSHMINGLTPGQTIYYKAKAARS